jgi:hypothetical protein
VQSDELTKAQKEASQAEKDVSEMRKNYLPARTKVDALLGTFHFRVEKIDDDLAKAVDDNLGPVERLNLIAGTKDRLLTAHQDQELKQLVDEISELGKTFIPLDANRIVANATLKMNQDRVKALQDNLRSLQDSLSVLIATQSGKQSIDQSAKTTIDGPTLERVENALSELFTSTNFVGRFINSLIITPPDILTLTLVISMGLLGSALQMTHALFMHGRIKAIGVYFLRLTVGAITALGIFIVAKAGVPVITDASRLGGDAPINPYFVSFLAIISGLMSENATFRRRGRGFLHRRRRPSLSDGHGLICTIILEKRRTAIPRMSAVS